MDELRKNQNVIIETRSKTQIEAIIFDYTFDPGNMYSLVGETIQGNDFEEFYVEEYEVDYMSISNSRYNFRQYRECSSYESGYFYAEECDDFYCDIRIERIAWACADKCTSQKAPSSRIQTERKRKNQYKKNDRPRERK